MHPFYNINIIAIVTTHSLKEDYGRGLAVIKYIDKWSEIFTRISSRTTRKYSYSLINGLRVLTKNHLLTDE